MSRPPQFWLLLTIVAISAFLTGRFFPMQTSDSSTEAAVIQCEQKMAALESKIEEIGTVKGEDCKALLLTAQGQVQGSNSQAAPAVGNSSATPTPNANSAPVGNYVPNASGSAPADVSTESIRTKEEADEFLKSIAQQNLFSSIRSAEPIRRDALLTLSGRFEGKVTLLDHSQKPLDVNFELEVFNVPGDKDSGKYRIQLFKDGIKTDDTSGEGSFPDIQSLAGTTSGILVKSSPRSYLQLYWVDRMNQFIGHYYRQETVDNYVRSGTVLLRKL